MWKKYRSPDKFLARPGRKQANVSVRMAWIAFGALPCGEKKTWWQFASRFCWNLARSWHAAELMSFLVGLRTYQHPCTLHVPVDLQSKLSQVLCCLVVCLKPLQVPVGICCCYQLHYRAGSRSKVFWETVSVRVHFVCRMNLVKNIQPVEGGETGAVFGKAGSLTEETRAAVQRCAMAGEVGSCSIYRCELAVQSFIAAVVCCC